MNHIQHLAAVMDGNRRWAQQRGLANFLGHRNGVQPIREIIEVCLKHQIKYLSLYTLSTENLKRGTEEVNFLIDLIIQGLTEHLPEFLANGVRVRFIGDRTYLPLDKLSSEKIAQVNQVCDQVELATAHLEQLNLNFLFCYGAQQEILAAVKKLALRVATGELQVHNITAQDLEDSLWTAGIPAPDLIIRPGNRPCMSNFLLYQGAYSELYYTEKLWPAMQQADFELALTEFGQRRRSWGLTAPAAQAPV